jgi:multisubunit Na+/H+ antiporter MnhE subunit
MRGWLLWWLVLAGLYLVLADSVKAPELAVGAVAAAVGATGAVLVGRSGPPVRLQARWLVAAARALPGVLGDLGTLARVLVVRGVLRRAGEGTLVEVRFAATSDEPGDLAYRGVTQALGSLAPNTIVVDVDKARGVLLAHQLSYTPDVAEKATPLP